MFLRIGPLVLILRSSRLTQCKPGNNRFLVRLQRRENNHKKRRLVDRASSVRLLVAEMQTNEAGAKSLSIYVANKLQLDADPRTWH
jgi:hypothetical protein